MDNDWHHEEPEFYESCSHIAIVSCSETECQCMDCLRIWPKAKNFVSDWPQHDAG